MTDTENTLPSVVARLERDLGTARLYGEQQCARADQAERECLRLVNVICEHVAKRKEYFDRAEEAVANVAEMMGPVKSCETCRNSHIYHADAPCNVCADNSRRTPFKSQWEPCHD